MDSGGRFAKNTSSNNLEYVLTWLSARYRAPQQQEHHQHHRIGIQTHMQ
jgi:hypothetical protein